jgi:alanine racemase
MTPRDTPQIRAAVADGTPDSIGAPALARVRSRTWATIDLDALASNLTGLRSSVPSGTRVMAVVKADGYGHGMVPVARAALSAGATWLGVATPDEALAMRSAETTADILVLGPAGEEWLDALADADCAITIGDSASLDVLTRRTAGRPVRVHVKVDTGMTRFGVSPNDVADVVRVLAGARARVEGLFTHLAAADDPDPAATIAQLEAFERAAVAARRLVPQIICHAAASAAVLAHPGASFDMIRLGMAMYGVSPLAEPRAALVPVMALRSRVARVVAVGPGTPVSYGFTYRTASATRIATVSIGYADGYPRALGNTGVMIIGGRRVPVVGRVCMDYAMLDVQDIGVREGDDVTVFGDGLPVAEVAATAGTIAYEIVTRIGPRVPRLYLRSGRPTESSTVVRSLEVIANAGDPGGA